MYDELIGRLRANGELFLKYIPNAEGEILLQAADAIEELSKRVDESIPNADAEIIISEVAKPRWIPVTEQLPPAKKEVYVTDGEYIARANLLDDVFPGDKPCWSYSGLGEITHWCEQIPLPEPPKEE